MHSRKLLVLIALCSFAPLSAKSVQPAKPHASDCPHAGETRRVIVARFAAPAEGSPAELTPGHAPPGIFP
jgi:hypothetical protein